MKSEVENLSFEESLKKLEEIVRLLEKGDCPLEKAVEYYDLGTLLKNRCTKELNKAKGRLEKVLNENGDKEQLTIV